MTEQNSTTNPSTSAQSAAGTEQRIGRFGLVIALVVGLFLCALAVQQPDLGFDPPQLAQSVVEVPAITGEGPRYAGRMGGQTALEESRAQNWAPPTGDQPVFTTDWISLNLKNWERDLGHLKGVPGVRGLEIGSFEGRSAIWFAKNILTHPDSTLTCVDLFGARLDAFFDHNIRVSGIEKQIIKLQGKSQDVLRTLPADSYDFVYVDGCHLATCALTDMVLGWDLLKMNGTMIVDDYGWQDAPVLDRPLLAVDAFLQIYAPAIEITEKGFQVAFRKTGSGY